MSRPYFNNVNFFEMKKGMHVEQKVLKEGSCKYSLSSFIKERKKYLERDLILKITAWFYP